MGEMSVQGMFVVKCADFFLSRFGAFFADSEWC